MPYAFNRFKQQAVRFDAEPGPGCLLSVDAGAKKAGAALWAWSGTPEKAVLIDAATLKAKTDDELPRVVHLWATLRYVVGYYAVERPKKRKNKRRYHKDLDRLLDFINATAQLIGGWTLQLYPEEWKGGVGSTFKSKEPHWQRIREALSPTEQTIFDKAGPDGKDAVGIGLFVLGRTGRGGTRVV